MSLKLSKYKIIFLILFLIYIALFIGFIVMALEDSQKSTNTSNGVVEVVVEVVEAVTPNDYEVNVEKVSIITRKMIGHFGYNLIMGMILMFAIYFLFRKDTLDNFQIKYLINYMIIAALFSIIVAVVSELCELIPEGRSCEIKDMFIDYGGSIIGILICYLILLIVFKTKAKKDKELNNYDR